MSYIVAQVSCDDVIQIQEVLTPILNFHEALAFIKNNYCATQQYLILRKDRDRTGSVKSVRVVHFSRQSTQCKNTKEAKELL